jgi:hypothetical protein
MIREHGALRLELPFGEADAVRTTLSLYVIVHQLLYLLFYTNTNTYISISANKGSFQTVSLNVYMSVKVLCFRTR